MIEPLGLSIIISNYNNVRFFAERSTARSTGSIAICEVIVVDDGSIDSSLTFSRLSPAIDVRQSLSLPRSGA
jgi:hypothetical protein